MMDFVLRNDGFCIENDGVCIKDGISLDWLGHPLWKLAVGGAMIDLHCVSTVFRQFFD